VGALSILAVLLLTLAIGATGWAGYNELAGEWVSELHEGVANTMLVVIAVHVAGVVLSSRMHHENLARAMLTGHKSGTPQDAIRSAWWSLAAVMVLAVGGFWWLQWQGTGL
jgi:cytochrome b